MLPNDGTRKNLDPWGSILQRLHATQSGHGAKEAFRGSDAIKLMLANEGVPNNSAPVIRTTVTIEEPFL
jgi:hypothetical protein